MKKQLEKLLDGATKDTKSIIISSAIIASIATVLYIGYYVWSIPTNAQLVLPGETYHLSEEINVDDTNLYKVGVFVIFPEKRWDIIEFMWKSKTFISRYYAYSLDNLEDINAKELKIDHFISSLEADVEKYTTLETYLLNEYGKEQADDLVKHLRVFEKAIGNSDTLALALLLKQIAENEVIHSSDNKVVITGNMDEVGTVLPVGEVPMKAITADIEDADYFIVPAEQYEQAIESKEYNDLSLEIRPVQSIDEAYDLLQEIE